MKSYAELVDECRSEVDELFPWDLAEKLEAGGSPLLLDVREPDEFNAMHIRGALNVPRGILESAAEWDQEDTVPELVRARGRDVVVICRSGNRSLLAARTLKWMGFESVVSLKTGVRGWNDYEQLLIDREGRELDIEVTDDYLLSRVREDQLAPKGE